jgi:hypothetical protein
MIGSFRLLSGVAFAISSSVVLASHTGQQLSGVAGLPVEGHEIVAVFQIQGSKHFNLKRAQDRFQAEGINVRLGRPIDGGTICQIKEVVRDVMADKGFPNAEVTHDLVPLPPKRFSPNAVRLTISIIEGRRLTTHHTSRKHPMTPFERCQR